MLQVPAAGIGAPRHVILYASSRRLITRVSCNFPLRSAGVCQAVWLLSIQRENSSMTSFTRETVMADTRRVTRFTLRLRNHLGTVLATAALLALLWLGVVTPAMDRAGALGAQQPPPPTRTTLPDDTPVISPGQPSASP